MKPSGLTPKVNYYTINSRDTMGDLLSPKRQDVIDRLKRRFELYKRRHNGVQQRYEFGKKALNEQSSQSALLLRQKWLESKAKKASKSKTKSDNTGSDHRNQMVTKKLRSKIDKAESSVTDLQQHIQTHAENVYRFDEDDGPSPAKTHATSTSCSASNVDVSVHINVHQVTSSGSKQDQTISANVTVNQTVRAHVESESDKISNVECKQEPSSVETKLNNSTEDNNNDSDIGQDFEDIFNAFEKEKDIDLPTELIDELKKFDEIYNTHVQESEGSSEAAGLKTSENSNMFASNMYMDASAGQGQVRSPPYRGASGQTVSAPITEGGLAAETLKQLAAQHQQHQPHVAMQQKQFGMKSAIDPFSDMSDTGNYSTARNGYPQEYYNTSSAGNGSYLGQNSIGYSNKPTISGYGMSPKQMTHYAPSPVADTGPSSLQQLQNQVAHFNTGPQMEITQTQQLQLSDGSHRMQMSQTQQIQLRQQPFPNISLTQQQGFSTSPNMGSNTSQSPPYMGDPMGMQSQHGMVHGKMHPDQRQHMPPQYMGRPPPEYKMQHAANGMSGMNSNGMGPNPLETIQNMVNTHPNQAYSSGVKSESNDIQNGMRSAQMSAMQQQQQHQQMGMSMSQAQLSYSNQSMQRQGSFPGAMPHQMAARPQQRPNTPSYTSAIMRNQRPPNVNIGPDGLNISQPRHAQEWAARGMNPMVAQAPRPGVQSTSPNMMHYRSFSTDGAAAQMQMHHQGQTQRSMHMNSMQSQHSAMMQQQQQHGNNPHAQQQMMMQQQHQRMQMSQQMAAQGHRQTPPYGMSQGYPQTSSSQDDILNLLDSAPNQSTDFFDVQTGVGSAEANWYDIEDILGNAVK
ncbi:neurogenic protein mastermind-like [Dreissena polymorpha]|uniref:Neurogenic mastermind-like N-terminal domain-containing protein n=1 Tax=Dreissena polymorpha TaxID=45954 RepID=A0A9D4K5J6_DREPO|nr:neurogenic protein mastermind-like [Dreissena polymorpha]KAH3833453.1 hypothetical protein DPMN_106763 [Dreissena polymorpha]